MGRPNVNRNLLISMLVATFRFVQIANDMAYRAEVIASVSRLMQNCGEVLPGATGSAGKDSYELAINASRGAGVGAFSDQEKTNA